MPIVKYTGDVLVGFGHNNLINRAAVFIGCESKLLFENLADTKEVHAQVQLFTPNATSETFVNGASVSKLTGRDALEKAFGTFLANFETVYHFNGQQTLTLNGDNAMGTSYCMVTLIGNENRKKMKTTIDVIYKDEFVHENNHWLIANRKANFNWQEKQPLAQ